MYTDHLLDADEYEEYKQQYLESQKQRIIDTFHTLKEESNKYHPDYKNRVYAFARDIDSYRALKKETYKEYKKDYIKNKWEGFNFFEEAWYIFIRILEFIWYSFPIWGGLLAIIYFSGGFRLCVSSQPSSLISEYTICHELSCSKKVYGGAIYCYVHSEDYRAGQKKKEQKKNSNSTSNSKSNYSTSIIKDDPYDKYWYDDPDDFADDWADEFDSYDDAYDYWEDE